MRKSPLNRSLACVSASAMLALAFACSSDDIDQTASDSGGTSGAAGAAGSGGVIRPAGTGGMGGLVGTGGAGGVVGTGGVIGTGGGGGVAGAIDVGAIGGKGGATGSGGSVGVAGAIGTGGTGGVAGALGGGGVMGVGGANGVAGATGSAGRSGEGGTSGIAGVSGIAGWTGSAGSVGSGPGTAGAPSAGAAGSAACAPVPDGLVAWWTANDTFESAAASQHTISASGLTFTEGETDKAFLFNGSALASVAHASDLNLTSALAIEGWVRPSADGVFVIMAKWGDYGAWSGNREFTFVTMPGGALRFAVSDDAHQNDGSFHAFDSPAAVLTLGQWSHVAATFDGSTGTRVIYANGVEVARRQDGAMALTVGIADLGIGCYVNEPGSRLAPLSGALDELSLYHRALSLEEIRAVYAAGSVGKCRQN